MRRIRRFVSLGDVLCIRAHYPGLSYRRALARWLAPARPTRMIGRWVFVERKLPVR